MLLSAVTNLSTSPFISQSASVQAVTAPVIDWIGFIIVAVVTMVGAGFVVVMYSLGVRLSAISDDDDATSPMTAKIGSYVCFSFSALVVIIGIVMIVPPFFKFAMHLLNIDA